MREFPGGTASAIGDTDKRRFVGLKLRDRRVEGVRGLRRFGGEELKREGRLVGRQDIADVHRALVLFGHLGRVIGWWGQLCCGKLGGHFFRGRWGQGFRGRFGLLRCRGGNAQMGQALFAL